MDHEWAGLSVEEKTEKLFESWLRPKGVNFISPEAEKAYRARATRIRDAVQLKLPDRVPVVISAGDFPIHYAGMTVQEGMYDYDKLCSAYQKFNLDYGADAYTSAARGGAGRVYDTLDYKLYMWAGHGIGPNRPLQCVEAEYMKADEYDDLIRDPSDFWMRVYIPRIMGALEPFSKLYPFSRVIETPGITGLAAPFGRPEVQEAFKALFRAGEETLRWRQIVKACDGVVMAAGFPGIGGGASRAPFDVLGDTLRGTRGIMMDMYRQPDKLHEAMERLTPLMIQMGISGCLASGSPWVGMPLHKGADNFLSDAQYREFYWPTLKKVFLGLMEEGLIPIPFAEGSYNNRLEIIRELPVGK
ncbi:MAG: uroporphyrinogen decarboxylase, partial [Desulfobacterales bacterium]|nr:uroporphyrinogen decarboxylase [Desulfobacterales bacterium]